MNLRKLLYSIGLPMFLLLSLAGYSQDKVVTGKVTDPAGAGVAGVSILVKGTDRGTTTAEDGTYSISVPANATLVFSYVGYTAQEFPVSGRTSINVNLQSTAGNLNEVVVVGYGTQRRRDVSGAITTISSKDFVKGQVTSPEQLIAGKVAGVQITSNGGAPGAGSTIRIRGGASLNASNDPLIILDGVALAPGGIAGQASPLALINPNDIETFNILKDASATAIYGSRASNGVIIITTKKGRSGAPRVSFSTQLSYAKPISKVDVFTADEFRSYVDSFGSAAQGALMGTASTDWQDEIYQDAIGTDNNISIAGGMKNMPYRFSFGYLYQNGILRTGNLERYSAGMNLSPKFFDNHLRVDVNVKGSLSSSRFANEGAIGAASTFDPTKPVKMKSDRYGGYWEWLDPSTKTGLLALSPRNPVGMLEQFHSNSDVRRMIGNIIFDYKFHFLPDLRFNLNLGLDVSRGEGTVLVNDSAAHRYKRYEDPVTKVLHGGDRNEYQQERKNKLMEAYLNYVKDIPSIDSRIDIMAGYGYQDFKTTDYFFPDRTYNGMVASTPKFAYDIPQNTIVSYYGRLNYTLKDRYVLTATVRRDGSSRFNPDNRWGTFPSFAGAWRMKEESFLKNSDLFSELKLRVGYGITGQQDGIGNYDYITYYSLSDNEAQYQLGDTFYGLSRPNGYYYDRKWEETATTNIGVDFGLWNNRITGSVEYYIKKTTNLLNEIVQPALTNFSNRTIANVGDMENKGVEFNVNAELIRNNDLRLSIGFNATYNENEVTKLTVSDDPNYAGTRFFGISGGTGQTLKINSTGYNRGAFYVYKQVYGKDGKPIDGMFEDINRDGIINEKDLYRYKGSDPIAFFGFSSDLTYKQFSAGFVMRANLDNYVYNNVNSNLGVKSVMFGTGYLNNAYSDLAYTNFSGGAAGFSLSDYYVENASFIKMDNIYLGYNVGPVFKKSAQLRLNANIQNVFVITNYTGLDPEIASGVDNNFYPRPRTFVLGATLEF